ncbi:DNA-directed DNA polymerase II small subunit [Candidatus Micrarchaeota archaeon]|nr:DNA-directed DNA polymerase II small subunit [Candidatus Micrarchaeota archaeon]
MQVEEFLKSLIEKDILITPDALELLKSSEEAFKGVNEILTERNVFILTKQIIEEKLKEKEEKKVPLPEEIQVNRSGNFKPLAREYKADFKIIERHDVSGKSKCTGIVDDFVGYFRDRYRKTLNVLRTRTGKVGISPMISLKSMMRGREVRIAGIVNSKNVTKKGDLLIEMEDEEEVAKVLVLKNDKECFEKANKLIMDEVVAVDGRASGPFVIANDIVWPELPINQQKKTEKDLGIAFISDTHVGSRFFMQKQFVKMLKWLNGGIDGDRNRELVGKIKYLILAGDVVDGIGVYPRQEKELVIRDIYGQYKEFGKLLQNVPDYIEVFIGPGNHDAVRRAEPQPKLPKELTDEINAPANVHYLGSPSTIEVEGLKTLVYHGTSIDSVIASIPGLSYQNPEKCLIELLKRRHLSPIYGENPIVPEEKDYMFIEDSIDIFHTGHVHRNGYVNYRGVAVVNSGAWQDRTDFQVRQGHVPTPCIMPIYETHYAKMNFVNFLAGEGV